MKPKIARQLISFLGGLSARCDEFGMKIAAAESILERHPELNKEYQKELNAAKRRARFVGSAVTLEALEKELSQD